MSFRIRINSQKKGFNILKQSLINAKVKLPNELNHVSMSPKMPKKSTPKLTIIHIRSRSQNHEKLKHSQMEINTKPNYFLEGNLRNTWHFDSFSPKKTKSSGAFIRFKNKQVPLNGEEYKSSEQTKCFKHKKFSSTIRHMKTRSLKKQDEIQKQKMLSILRLKLKDREVVTADVKEHRKLQTRQAKRFQQNEQNHEHIRGWTQEIKQEDEQ